MTEDNGPDGFYRYLPNHRGQLHRGGKLQMLCVNGRSKYDTVTGQKVGKKLPLRVGHDRRSRSRGRRASPHPGLRAGPRQGRGPVHGPRGLQLGPGQRLVHGQRGRRHQARPGLALHAGEEPQARHAELVFESIDRSVLDQPDAICVSPRGGVLLCEDGDGEDLDGGTNNLRVLTPKGKMETFAINSTPARPAPLRRARRRGLVRLAASGPAPAYSPDGKWLFVHLQYPRHHLRDHRALGKGLGVEPADRGRLRRARSSSTEEPLDPGTILAGDPRDLVGRDRLGRPRTTARPSRPASGAAPPAPSPTSRPTRPSSCSPAERRSSTTARPTRSAPATSASSPPAPRRAGRSTRT